MKTREEVEQLKENWLLDPVWDIEETEGFEHYYFELLEFKQNTDYAKQNDERLRINAISSNLDCSPMLLTYVESLEHRIEELESKIKDLSK